MTPRAVPTPPDVALDVRALAQDRCEACWLHGQVVTDCLEIHHRLPRSRARNLHDRHNCVVLCHGCHTAAHAGLTGWPWLVEGTMLRGTYTGPDPLSRALYPDTNSHPPLPPYLLVAASYPDTNPRAVCWAWARARDFKALR